MKEKITSWIIGAVLIFGIPPVLNYFGSNPKILWISAAVLILGLDWFIFSTVDKYISRQVEKTHTAYSTNETNQNKTEPPPSLSATDQETEESSAKHSTTGESTKPEVIGLDFTGGNLHLKRVKIINCTTGLISGPNSEISENEFSNNETGLEVKNPQNVKISKNKFTKNKIGMKFNNNGTNVDSPSK